MDVHVSSVEFLTLAEVADVLRCSRSTVYKWVESGRLEANRIGGRLIFDRAKLLAWISSHSTVASSSVKGGLRA